MSATISVYEPIAAASESSPGLGRALDTVQGKVIGFIDNAKPNFNHLADDLGELLVTRYGAAGVMKYRKPGQVPVAEGALASLAEKCDAVIAGSGD